MRRAGNSKLVFDKAKGEIVTVKAVPATDDERAISDRRLWDIAKGLHQDSAAGTANGLHIYFELQRVRDAARSNPSISNG